MYSLVFGVCESSEDGTCVVHSNISFHRDYNFSVRNTIYYAEIGDIFLCNLKCFFFFCFVLMLLDIYFYIVAFSIVVYVVNIEAFFIFQALLRGTELVNFTIKRKSATIGKELES